MKKKHNPPNHDLSPQWPFSKGELAFWGESEAKRKDRTLKQQKKRSGEVRWPEAQPKTSKRHIHKIPKKREGLGDTGPSGPHLTIDLSIPKPIHYKNSNKKKTQQKKNGNHNKQEVRKDLPIKRQGALQPETIGQWSRTKHRISWYWSPFCECSRFPIFKTCKRKCPCLSLKMWSLCEQKTTKSKTLCVKGGITMQINSINPEK